VLPKPLRIAPRVSVVSLQREYTSGQVLPLPLQMRLLLFLVMVSIGLSAQDPAKLAPHLYKVVLDNDDARVIDYHLKPGEKEPMHSHPSGLLVYYFTDAKARVTLPDGKTAETANRAGDIIWRDAVTHFAENIGSSEVHPMLVEPKVSCKATAPSISGSSSSTTSAAPMPARLEPHHRLRYENQSIRVLEVRLKPGESSSFHTHSHDDVYLTLADAVAKVQVQGGNWGPETAFRLGEASFDNASKHPFTHRLQNAGNTEFHTLDIEFCPLERP
jgi:quercetin dioxygenase-like cupin family protein